MINRICAHRHLTDVYAPGGIAGTYYVLSEVVGCFAGSTCIVGHVVMIDGRPKRVWFNP